MEDVNKRRRNFLSLSKLECSPQEINSREIQGEKQTNKQNRKTIREFQNAVVNFFLSFLNNLIRLKMHRTKRTMNVQLSFQSFLSIHSDENEPTMASKRFIKLVLKPHNTINTTGITHITVATHCTCRQIILNSRGNTAFVTYNRIKIKCIGNFFYDYMRSGVYMMARSETKRLGKYGQTFNRHRAIRSFLHSFY